MTVWFPPPEESAALKEAVKMLRSLEWVWNGRCPSCGAYPPFVEEGLGHDSVCQLDAFLKRWDKP